MTLLDLSLLGLLADQPMHGYELSKRLRELGDGRAGVSFGSLYPALGRLDRQGLVTTDTAAGDGAARLPMTGSLGAEVASLRSGEAAPAPRGRRNRKVYAITDSGRERLRTLLAEPSDDDRAFALQLAFGRHLDAEQRLALLRRRHAELSQRIDSESPRLPRPLPPSPARPRPTRVRSRTGLARAPDRRGAGPSHRRPTRVHPRQRRRTPPKPSP